MEYTNDLLSIELLLQQQNELLLAILGELQSGLHLKRGGNDKKYASRTPMCQDDMDALDEEIDLDWWFEAYGEESLPASYMNQSGEKFSKQEMDYLYRRLLDITSVNPTNEQGTHVFTSVGKIWCKREKNARNCFAFKPLPETFGLKVV